MRANSELSGGRRLPLTLFAAIVLGLMVLSGCGGDEEPAATITEATTTAPDPAEPGAADTSEEADVDESDEVAEEETGRVSGAESEGESESGDGDGGRAALPPNRHKDSGGGSEQFRTPGGDNSLQDFGEEAATDDFEEVAAVVHAFLDSRAAGNSTASCNYMADSIIDQLLQFAQGAPEAPEDCAGMLDALTVPLDAKMKRMIARADIGSVRVEDDHAFVLYRGAQKQVYVLPMAREDGQWKVAAIAGSPIL